MSESLEERVKLLEHEIERLHAVREIQNLMGRYQVLHTPKTFWKTPELFALKQPDVSVEIAMWGKMVGPDKVRQMYAGHSDREPEPGGMVEHQLNTPVIQVAKDGKTAKGLWFSCGHETYPGELDAEPGGKLIAHWNYGKFGADFIKEDGEWKIWHYHWLDTFFCPYDKSWVEYPQPGPDVIISPPGLNPDLPPTSRGTYFPDQVRRPIPDWPEPYDTWDGKSVC